jgi:hypothetical protein
MAEKPISPLRKLQLAANRLNSLSDQTAEQVRAMEALLNELSLGVSVGVPLSNDGLYRRSLEYRRRDDRAYHIAVVKCLPGLDPEEIKPWGQCSREIKLEAVQAIPDLIVELIDAIEDRIKESEHALGSLSQILPSQRQGGSDNASK